MSKLHYLAGFFDGEGSVGIYYEKKPKQWRAYISIVQNDSPQTRWLFKQWAAQFSGSITLSRSKVVVLRINQRTAQISFCDLMAPLCTVKRRQLIVLRNWLTLRDYTYRTSQLLKALKREAA